MKLRSLLLLSILVPPLAQAKQWPDASEAFVAQCRQATDCEIRLFTELSKTFRPSRKEDELRDYILAVKATAEKTVWKQTLETFRDPIGNLLIRLPATGEFVGKNKPHFALQSHMDMVLAYADAKPGENLEPYFKDGVSIEIKEGWIQSKGNRTTLGADNGIGVATELRYLIDDRIAHPPLELIFTVQEEIGLFGAAQFEIPILSKKMLCLDGMTPEEGMIIAGAQGGRAEVLHLQANAAPASDALLLNVSVTKMAGGHSAGDIHRGRTNAIKLLAELIHELGDVRIQSVVAGDVGVLNKIPNLFAAELLVPAASAGPDLVERVKAFLRARISQNADDIRAAEVIVTLSPASRAPSLAANFSQFLAGAIAAAPNGVIDRDPNFFESVFTSNNLSFLRLGSGAGTALSIDLGFFTRSFSNQRLLDVTKSMNIGFSNPAYVSDFLSEVKMDFPTWVEPDSSVLMKDVLERSGYFKRKFYMNGGLEPSAFKQRIPTLEVIALGPKIQFAHSVKERLKLDSIAPTLEGVKKIIQLQ